MKTGAIISNKGGAGKTTITQGIAGGAISIGGLTVAIADGDSQHSTAEWFEGRRKRIADDPAFAMPYVEEVTLTERSLKTFKDKCASNGADLLLIDTSPNSTDETLDAAEQADFLIVPCQPSFIDLRALKRTKTIVEMSGKPAIAVVNLTKHFGTESAATSRTLEQRHQFTVCPHVVRDLVSFKRAYAADQTIFEYEPSGEAAADIRRVYEFLCQHVDMSTRSHNGIDEVKYA